MDPENVNESEAIVKSPGNNYKDPLSSAPESNVKDFTDSNTVSENIEKDRDVSCDGGVVTINSSEDNYVADSPPNNLGPEQDDTTTPNSIQEDHIKIQGHDTSEQNDSSTEQEAVGSGNIQDDHIRSEQSPVPIVEISLAQCGDGREECGEGNMTDSAINEPEVNENIQESMTVPLGIDSDSAIDSRDCETDECKEIEDVVMSCTSETEDAPPNSENIGASVMNQNENLIDSVNESISEQTDDGLMHGANNDDTETVEGEIKQPVTVENSNNLSEDAQENVIEKFESTLNQETGEGALEESNIAMEHEAEGIFDLKDKGDNANASFEIDTSIFRGPPIDRSDVLVTDYFDAAPKVESKITKTPSPETQVVSNFPVSSVQTNQSFSSIADNKSAAAGPSDEREDISDEELELESSNSLKPVSGVNSNLISSSSVDNPNNLQSESFLHKSDNLSENSSSDLGDLIDLKLEDAGLKSNASSCDTEEHKQSKVSNEDLEAVSDDELPTVPQAVNTLSNQKTSLLDDREEVSSSEDENENIEQNLDATPISSGDEFPCSSHNEEPVKLHAGLENENIPDGHVRLEPLEAEPISDEEDNIVADQVKQESFDDGEAGEIKSPALGSPISEQGDLILGEMEPVSADESPDTDGELPSGDEADKDSKQGNRLDDKNFEAIDSDDDISGVNQKTSQNSVEKEGPSGKILKSEKGKGQSGDKGGYMETISDEENLEGEDSERKQNSSVTSCKEETTLDKGRIPTSFNEHQVELDYEETYGEDGETKLENKEEETKADSKLTDKEDGEAIEQGEVSDKDEGELSDDDCEEGEIKEPGQKKFIKPICRFFQRGHCTWGINCRFLHPGVNDKGNYQMIEIPGFRPVGIHARLGVPGQFPPEQQPPEEEEAEELPPPPIPDVPHVETAWERGLRIAKEQRKKASERKEQEKDFEEKRLNLSVDEERELNKENERTPRNIPKDPYYDQQAFEVDEYYKIPRDPWHTGGHYENFEVHYHQGNSFSPPPYHDKPPPPAPLRYTRPLSPPIDKFGRHREERPMPERHEPLRVSDYPPPAAKHPDEWIDPWRRSKSPKQRKPRSRSRGRRTRRSLSDSSDSSRSDSRSSSGSSRSSRSGSSSGSSSRSRSPEPAPPGVDRMDRQDRYGNDQPRSTVSVRGHDNHRGGFHRHDNFRNQRGGQGYNFHQGRPPYNSRQDSNYYQGGRPGNNDYRGRGGRGGFMGRGGYNNRGDPRDRDGRYGRNISPARGGRGPTPDRPLPYSRPRPKSRSSSRSSSSRSRSRSRSKSSDSSRSRSSSNSSRSSSSSSSSGGSADSDHLYRDLGSPSKNARHSGLHSSHKKKGIDNRKDRGAAKSNHASSASRHQPPTANSDRMPHPRSPTHSRADPKYSQIPLPPPGGRGDAKYASRNAPQPPVKAKDPLKVVGQKSNIKLTLLPKQQQSSNLGDRPNPLASPPHKRRMSERDMSPPTPPPNKRLNMSMQASSLRMAADKASKLQIRPEKAKSPPPGSLPPPPPSSLSSSAQRSKNPPLPASPQKTLASKSRPPTESAGSKPPAKAAPGGSTASNPSSAKSKKSMSSRREELLKQLKAVEDAIARKKFKLS